MRILPGATVEFTSLLYGDREIAITADSTYVGPARTRHLRGGVAGTLRARWVAMAGPPLPPSAASRQLAAGPVGTRAPASVSIRMNVAGTKYPVGENRRS